MGVSLSLRRIPAVTVTAGIAFFRTKAMTHDKAPALEEDERMRECLNKIYEEKGLRKSI